MKKKDEIRELLRFGANNGGNKILIKELEDKKEYYIVGDASDTTIDKENDFLTKECIDKVVSQIVGQTLFYEHKHTIDYTLGTIVKSDNSNNTMYIEALLENPDDNEHVTKIIKKKNNGINLGFSIYGRINDAKKIIDKNGDVVRQLNDIDVYEVSVVALPANNNTNTFIVSKSIDEFFDTIEGDKEMKNKDVVEKGILSDAIDYSELMDKIRKIYWAYTDLLYKIFYNNELDINEKINQAEEASIELINMLDDLVAE